MKLVFLGPPGAGKGTQAQKLSQKLNIPQISTGDIFRLEISKATPLGIKAKSYVEKGLLVPDELVVEMVMKRLENEDCKNGYILDGFPRTLTQAQIFDSQLEKLNDKLNLVIYFKIGEDEILKRLSGRRICPKCNRMYHIEFNPPKEDMLCDDCKVKLIQRKDDTPEVIKERIQVYYKQTQPLIDYYKNKHLLREVSAVGDKEAIQRNILEIVKEELKN